MSVSQHPHHSPIGEKKTPESPTVWEIMHDSVNDNTPGFLYWLIRIGTGSFVCALLLGIIRKWVF